MQLRKYQQEDVQKLLTQPSMGVFNEQRTGKTPTSLIAMKAKGVNRLLIVCPASLVYTWQEEYKQWVGADDFAFVITSAKDFNRERFEWKLNRPCIIVNYENLRDTKVSKGAWEKLLKAYKPDGLIVDEAHRCKSRDSANYKAVGKFRHVEHRLYLTATPAPNQPWEIWPILHLMKPNTFTSYWDFVHEFFVESPTYTGSKVIMEPLRFKPGMEEQLQKILDIISVMRKRRDVMPWLPQQDAPTKIKLPCTPAQKKYLTDLEETFETEHVNTQSILERIVRVRQICSAPAILNLKGNSPKVDWLKQYIKDYPEKHIIVFSNSKKLIGIVSRLVECVTITGDTPLKERQQHIVSFQKGTTRVIVIQTQAGKEGLTLDTADVTIFLDTYPPAADYLQAKDRMIPICEEHVKPQEIIHLMMKDTYDEQLYKLVDQNVDSTDVINDYVRYLKERSNK